MVKILFVTALGPALALSVATAQQPAPNKIVVPVSEAPANNGKQMYVNFCAPCHGADGKGQGPVAAALKQQPANLTLLSKKNGGNFPEAHVVSVLQFGSANPAHGTAQMPVWGPTLGRMNPASMPQSDARSLRINNLVLYLRSLQEK